MTDLALAWNAAEQRADMAVAAGDLLADDSLATAVILSLGTDARAAADEALPDPRDTDRRGWWGDLPVDAATAPARPDRLGSRLWLLRRSTATARTARLAEAYAREALAWLVEDRVAQSVDVATQLLPGRIDLAITIRRGREGAAWSTTWAVTLGGSNA